MNVEWYRNMTMISLNTSSMMIDDGTIATVTTVSRIEPFAMHEEAEIYDIASWLIGTLLA